MSALLDDLPLVPVPSQARRAALRLVPVADPAPASLTPPRVARPVRALTPLAAPTPLRLTRRGIAVLTAAVAALAIGLVGLAWLSAPAGAGRAPVSTVVGNTVAVAPGDSLWTIAGRVAPNRDPRAEVADLQRLNHLTGSALVAGQLLRVH